MRLVADCGLVWPPSVTVLPLSCLLFGRICPDCGRLLFPVSMPAPLVLVLLPVQLVMKLHVVLEGGMTDGGISVFHRRSGSRESEVC